MNTNQVEYIPSFQRTFIPKKAKIAKKAGTCLAEAAELAKQSINNSYAKTHDIYIVPFDNNNYKGLAIGVTKVNKNPITKYINYLKMKIEASFCINELNIPLFFPQMKVIESKKYNTAEIVARRIERSVNSLVKNSL